MVSGDRGTIRIRKKMLGKCRKERKNTVTEGNRRPNTNSDLTSTDNELIYMKKKRTVLR